MINVSNALAVGRLGPAYRRQELRYETTYCQTAASPAIAHSNSTETPRGQNDNHFRITTAIKPGRTLLRFYGYMLQCIWRDDVNITVSISVLVRSVGHANGNEQDNVTEYGVR